jgi:BASS family bile acid:Na+ symporter
MVMRSLLWLLEASGRQARMLLPLGVVMAFFMPETGGAFKPAAPFLLTLLVSAAMVRLDIAVVLKDAIKPRRLLRNCLLAMLLLLATPYCLYHLAAVANLSEPLRALIIWYAASPPIGTTIWMCVFLGFSAPIAMEIVLLTNLLAPFTGPFIGELLIGTAVPLSVVTLSFRLGAILFGGVLVALVVKWWLGESRINANRGRLDGIATLLMLAFLLPVFDGVRTMVFAAPLLTLGLAGLATALNFGHQASIFLGGRLFAAFRRQSTLPNGTRSVAVVSGNRNLGLYFAALPADPLFSLFVAAYQIPIYLTPMVAGWFGDRVHRKNQRSNSIGR